MPGYRKSGMLLVEDKALRRGYWQDVANVERELRAFMGLYGIAGRMPTSRELQSRGANSLYGAIHKHGGFTALAQRLGLRPRRYGLPRSCSSGMHRVHDQGLLIW